MALNQLQTKAESALAAVSSIDEIAHIRIITKAGESRKATPTQAATLLAPLLAPQLAPLLGIDYSLLTEQIVPGEYFINLAGERKQVYTKTYHGTEVLGASGDKHLIIDNLLGGVTMLDVRGSYAVGGNAYFNNTLNAYSVQEIGSFSDKWSFRCVSEVTAGRFSVYLLNILPAIAASIAGTPAKYSINIKYAR